MTKAGAERFKENDATDDDLYSNPCEKVRQSCRKWIESNAISDINKNQENEKDSERRCSVSIQMEHINTLVDTILQKKAKKPTWIEWDEEEWHYQGANFKGSEQQRQERVALYILALDAINFCFWPTPQSKETENTGDINSLEYDHLATALKKLAEADDDDLTSNGSLYAFSPHRLAKTTYASMKEQLEPKLMGHYLDNMETRSKLWKEVGEVLLKRFNGSAMNMIQEAQGSATKLVELILCSFPGFRDEVMTRDDHHNSSSVTRIVFLKRAQIFVGDVNAALKLNLHDLDKLTTFADYRVPQILREYSILEYSPRLAGIVDEGQEIPAGSDDEISIRAGTVIAVEEVVKALNLREAKSTRDQEASASSQNELFTDVNVDWYLWQVGETMNSEGLLKPFHKVRTQFY